MDLHLYFYSNHPICRIFSKNSPSLISCFTFIHFSFALMWNRNDGYLKIQAPLISIYIPNILKVLQPAFAFNSLMLFFWMRLMFWRNVKFVHVCMHVCVCGSYSSIFVFTLKVIFSLRVTLLDLVFLLFLFFLLLRCWGWNPECCAWQTSTRPLGYACSSDVPP